MTAHPKREYTPEEIKAVANRLRNHPIAVTDAHAIDDARDMLESLASQLAAQKRDGEKDEWRDTLALAAETLEVECEHQAEGGHDLECARMKRAAAMIRFILNQPPSPDQDREVSP